MLSDFSVKCLDKLQMKHTNGKKLIPNLYNKKDMLFITEIFNAT